jgi:hypothetical protein
MERGDAMEQSNVNELAVRRALAQLPARFRTRDLSEHALMVADHREYQVEGSYHSVIGTYLSRNRDSLGLHLEDDRDHPQGVLWDQTRR